MRQVSQYHYLAYLDPRGIGVESIVWKENGDPYTVRAEHRCIIATPDFLEPPYRCVCLAGRKMPWQPGLDVVAGERSADMILHWHHAHGGWVPFGEFPHA